VNILALVGQLGHALVSWGLSGGDEGAPPEIVLACPVIEISAPVHTIVGVTSPSQLAAIDLPIPTHLIIAGNAQC
jgi:hypothetical protein